MKKQFNLMPGAIALMVSFLTCGISTFGYSTNSATTYNTYKYVPDVHMESSFLTELLSFMDSYWFAFVLLGLFLLTFARHVWISRQCNIWNKLLVEYIEQRKSENSLTNYKESDLNRAFLDADLNTFWNFNLWTHKQMTYCKLIHNDVMNYNNKKKSS